MGGNLEQRLPVAISRKDFQKSTGHEPEKLPEFVKFRYLRLFL
jgi:hypothetical protein